MSMRFRNSDVDPAAPVESWGFDNVLTAVDRGGLLEWRRLVAAVRRAPYGHVARQLEVAVATAAEEAPAACDVLRYALETVRADHDRRLQAIAGDRIRSARVAAGLTQEQLARRAGVARPLLSSYERGVTQPTLPVLLRLEEAAGTTPSRPDVWHAD